MKSVALVSPCGHGNLGDAAIQQMTLEFIGKQIPDTEVVGVTLVPEDTWRRHGIPAFPLASRSLPQYEVRFDEMALHRGPEPPQQDRSVGSGAGSSPLAPRSGARGRIAGIAVKAARALLPRGSMWAVRTEVTHVARALRLLKRVDLVIISGGGQLDDFWGGPWGHPYALLKWALLARLSRARVAFLSVGVGSLGSVATRVMIRLALRLAEYRSYRDESSEKLVRRAGYRGKGSVVPDLAYGLASSRLGSHTPTAGRIGRVAVSPMIYCKPPAWPVENMQAYSLYIDRLVEASVWLVRRGVEVTLFTSDAPDKDAVHDFIVRLERDWAPEDRAGVEIAETDSVEDLLSVVGEADAVVASRLHGVILSHVSGKPVLALSYDRKVDIALKQLGQERYALPIDEFDLSAFGAAFELLDGEYRSAQESVERGVSEFAQAVVQQFEKIFPPEDATGRQSE